MLKNIVATVLILIFSSSSISKTSNLLLSDESMKTALYVHGASYELIGTELKIVIDQDAVMDRFHARAQSGAFYHDLMTDGVFDYWGGKKYEELHPLSTDKFAFLTANIWIMPRIYIDYPKIDHINVIVYIKTFDDLGNDKLLQLATYCNAPR